MFRFAAPTLICAAIITAVACSKEDDKKTELEGTWAKSCMTGNTTKDAYVFAADRFTFTQTIYTGAGCTGSVKGTVEQKGTFALTGLGVAGAKLIDFTQSSQTLRPTAGQAASFTRLCTGVTFTDNQATDIAGKNCNGTAGLGNGQKCLATYLLSGSQVYFASGE